MKQYFKEYLFDKNIFVAEGEPSADNVCAVLFTLAKKFKIRIVKGAELATVDTIRFAVKNIITYIPESFYRGFPKSVLELSPDERALDQLFHYAVTYGYGNFDAPGYSIFERDFERAAFDEDTLYRTFTILTHEDAERELARFAEGLLSSSRPINSEQLEFLLNYNGTYGLPDVTLKSKDTAVRLFHATKDLRFTKTLMLSDVIKYLKHLQFTDYGTKEINKLNLKNKDRKVITGLLDTIFEEGRADIVRCFERRRAFVGLLHHIHYKPKNDAAEQFLDAMRHGKNGSVYSDFEKLMAEGDPVGAARFLTEQLGSGALLRHLNYIVSRTERPSDIAKVLKLIKTKNAIMLIQLIDEYTNYNTDAGARTFKFAHGGMLCHHTETEEETERRRSLITKAQAAKITSTLFPMLERALHGKLGKVYIDDGMKNIALPMNEGTSMGGAGVLPKGSRIHIDAEKKKLRAFTYWEKINDVDLSATAFSESGRELYDFYWATMRDLSEECIVFSGDQTAGYEGGSEFFDLNLALFKKKYRDVRYVIFTNNAYSPVPFSECVCRAGYMLRDIEDSGEVYEPKTVESSFTVNCDSTTAYLFGLDLKTNDFVWLNIAENSSRAVACTSDFSYLLPYFRATEIFNMKSLFEMLATEVVGTPDEADVIVSDKPDDLRDEKEIVRSCDFERVLQLLN